MTTIDRTPRAERGSDGAGSADGEPMLRIPRSARPVPTTAGHRHRRIPPLALIAALIVVAAVAMLGASAAGWLQGRGGMATSPSGERVAPTAGAPATDIKGWMTLQQVLDAYPITRDALYAHFAIPTDTDPATTLSSLSESGVSDLDVPALRAWIDEGAVP